MDKKISDFKDWLVEEELSSNTIKAYIFAVSDFYKKHKEFNKTNIIAWKQEMIRACSPKTINLRLCALDKWAQFIGYNLGKVKRVKYQKQTTVENAMDIESFNKLIKCLEDDGNKRWVAYYKLLALTGTRISEALSLTKRDLDRGIATLLTKNKFRQIYIPFRLQTECADIWNDLDKDDLLIQNRHGEKMTSRGFSSMMKKHSDLYGIPKEKMHPHAFRHMFAIEFLKNNPDISLLADLLGHSGVNTTMIYTRRTKQEQIRDVNKAVTW